MSTGVTPQSVSDLAPAAVAPRAVRVYGHSYLYYWWPVWAVGALMALLTYIQGVEVEMHGFKVLMHPSRNLGVLFTFTVLLVVLLTNVAVRGLASVAVILTAIAGVLFLAWMGWWDSLLEAIGHLAIYMNLGFYVFFSVAIFLLWFLSVFIFDRLEHWTFQPGQLVYVSWLGNAEQTFDTRGMSVTKQRSDLFRHWILGLGSGDLHIAATGAIKGDFTVRNVLFVGTKLAAIQQLVSLKPSDKEQNVFTAGQPA
jgi:hypothetical protein